VHPLLVVLLGCALGAACAQAEGGPSLVVSSEPAPEQTPAVDAAEPASDAGGGRVCPAPAHDPLWTCFPMPYWARDPATRACCPYGALCEVPHGWAAFESEAECQSDCRCEGIEPYQEEPISLGIARQSLECACGSGGCATSVPDASQQLCDSGAGVVILSHGCGKLEVATGPNLSVRALVFDAATDRLIGLYSAGDTLQRPCLTSATISGVEFDCPEAVRCLLCGTTPDNLPSCEVR
jgi:hypothetical protein